MMLKFSEDLACWKLLTLHPFVLLGLAVKILRSTTFRRGTHTYSLVESESGITDNPYHKRYTKLVYITVFAYPSIILW
jgi:hypothetical protein